MDTQNALRKLWPRSFVRAALYTAAFLLLPAVASLFSHDIVWGLADFVIAGGLLFAALLLYEVLVTKVQKKYRRAAELFVILLSFLVWAELAVGVFGTPFAGD